ncbi:MAG: hypothetical protein KOO63_05720 [Bacteroidales bacterium]|nr:hypothetical protein [Candidatus Latescibacterota bacterium]
MERVQEEQARRVVAVIVLKETKLLWFQHKSQSADSPFISELIELFGGDGYMVYFVAMEIIADNFDVDSPGETTISCAFFRKKTALSRQLLLKILKFCDKKGRLFVTEEGRHLTLNCPKFAKLCDNYTQTLLRSKKEVDTKLLNSPRARSKKVEEEKDLKTKKKPSKKKTNGKSISASPPCDPEGSRQIGEDDNVIPLISHIERAANKAHKSDEYEYHYELFCDLWPYDISPEQKRLAYITWLEHWHVNIREVNRKLKKQILDSKQPKDDIVAYVASFKGKQLQHVEGGW